MRWGDGLPAGMHQVEIIKRMRTRKAWMDVLPPMDTPSNIKIRTAITEAIEANEWAFREAVRLENQSLSFYSIIYSIFNNDPSM